MSDINFHLVAKYASIEERAIWSTHPYLSNHVIVRRAHDVAIDWNSETCGAFWHDRFSRDDWLKG